VIGRRERWYRFTSRRVARLAEEATRATAEHHPGTRYNCQACDEYTPWPCAEARRALLVSFRGDRMALMTYLGVHLTKALQALPDTHPALLVSQIIYWVPRRRN
jgi:hypothetical protein